MNLNRGWHGLSLTCQIKIVQKFNETNVQSIMEAAINPPVILNAFETGRRQIKAVAEETLPHYIQTIIDPTLFVINGFLSLFNA